MKFSTKILWLVGGLCVVILGLDAFSAMLLNRQRAAQQEAFRNARVDRDCLDLIIRAEAVHMNLYKALSWASAGYDGDKVSALIAEQLVALDAIATALARPAGDNRGAQGEAAALPAQALAALKVYREWVVKIADLANVDASSATMLVGSAETAFRNLDTPIRQLVALNGADAERQQAQATQIAERTLRLLLVVGAAVVATAFGAGLWLARSMTRPILRTITEVEGHALQCAAASRQVSGVSQTLAVGSSQQAAALEEAAASLNELESMSKRTSESADQAKHLAKDALAVAETGRQAVAAMDQGMFALKSSSSDIRKIITTIDEIAFQTNLLALNAAVEAARAGEAGAGFAVVADEVRSLAQRSATAARETSAKIDEALARTETGVQNSAKVAASFAEIVEKSRQVDGFIVEMASASEEQSRGIKQIVAAVTQIDAITQNTAASAEETAGASRELLSHSEQTTRSVDCLARLVNGAVAAGAAHPPPPAPLAAVPAHAEA
ncbi:MAG TPA: methyl-accepting chemotaxis protein [Opitutaceae bacterium]|nr:methyl-accepting chemotaxis protein [Opitutaceae bacterium]